MNVRCQCFPNRIVHSIVFSGRNKICLWAILPLAIGLCVQKQNIPIEKIYKIDDSCNICIIKFSLATGFCGIFSICRPLAPCPKKYNMYNWCNFTFCVQIIKNVLYIDFRPRTPCIQAWIVADRSTLGRRKLMVPDRLWHPTGCVVWGLSILMYRPG